MTLKFRQSLGSAILLTSLYALGASGLYLASLPQALAENDPDTPLQVIELPEDESVEDIPPPAPESQTDNTDTDENADSDNEARAIAGTDDRTPDRTLDSTAANQRPIDDIIPDPAGRSDSDFQAADPEINEEQAAGEETENSPPTDDSLPGTDSDVTGDNGGREDRDLASADDLAPDEEMQQEARAADENAAQAEPVEPDPQVSRLPETVVVAETQPAEALPFKMLSGEVLPGTTARLAWSPDIQIAGLSQPTPVLVVNGARPGPVMCMTAAVHGDELNGIEIIRRIVYNLKPRELSGTVVGVPIVNLQGFQQGSRYLADRRDLNRYFPGSPSGSLAHRIAHSLFEQVISHCDMLVDIHTGSLKRTNLPQLRANMNDPDVAEFSRGFDSMVVVHSPGSSGMLRSAAGDAGIPAVTMEVGESMRIQEDQIEAGVNSITSLLERQRMTASLFQWGKPEPVYYNSHWVRTDHGGILFSNVSLGAYVTEGTVLGRVSDPITNEQFPIRADADGRIIGMAVDQVVMAGFAAYHLGSRAQSPEED